MKIIIASGGTGGHIYPGIALAEAARRKKHEVIFITETNALGKELISKEGWPLYTISVRPLIRKLSVGAVIAPFFLKLAAIQSWLLMLKLKPNLVITTGGYCSLPVILAAWFARVPVMIQEQNSSLGLANRIGQNFAAKVCLAFKDTLGLKQWSKAVFTGNPLCERIFRATREQGMARYQLDPSLRTLLVFGGSLGARKINETVPPLLDWLDEVKIQVVHITGERDFGLIKSQTQKKSYPHYHLVEYEDEMGMALKAADLVVSRAGATAISEILATGRPSILVPYPFAADNHQVYNTRLLEHGGAAIEIPDRDLTPALLRETIETLFENGGKLETMGQAAESLFKTHAEDEIITIGEKLVGV